MSDVEQWMYAAGDDGRTRADRMMQKYGSALWQTLRSDLYQAFLAGAAAGFRNGKQITEGNKDD